MIIIFNYKLLINEIVQIQIVHDLVAMLFYITGTKHFAVCMNNRFTVHGNLTATAH